MAYKKFKERRFKGRKKKIPSSYKKKREKIHSYCEENCDNCKDKCYYYKSFN